MKKIQVPIPLIRKQEIEDLKRGILEIDCPKMYIESQSPQNPDIYGGSGYIKQSLEGQFSFKLYSNQESMPDEYLKKLFSKEATKSGQIIPGHEYYDLEATDLYGRKWKSKRILAKFFFGKQERGIVLTGEIRELTYEIKAPSNINKARLNIKIFDKIDIPANKPTTSTTTVGENEILKSSHMNSAEFISCGNKFLLTNEDDLLNISIVSDKDAFEKNIEMRVIEALQFVLARPIRWSILEKSESKVDIIRIRSVKEDNLKIRLQPPINTPAIDHTSCTWKLYDKYLQYIFKHKEGDWHPLSSRIYRVFKASGYSYYTQALVLCTETEGTLKEEFPKLAFPSELASTLIKNVIKYIFRWEASENLNQKSEYKSEDIEFESNKLKKRISGFLKSIQDARAKDKLRSLAESGIIRKEHVNAWEELRNKLAHAYSPPSFPLQEFIDLFHKVLVLLYHLIFFLIDYKGKYTDYSKYGWLIKKYPFN